MWCSPECCAWWAGDGSCIAIDVNSGGGGVFGGGATFGRAEHQITCRNVLELSTACH